MTGFRIEHLSFSNSDVGLWSKVDARFSNWPVVYTLNNEAEVYVGESLNVAARMRQHLQSQKKTDLQAMHVVLDDRFNKSACLDLESHLIRLFAGEGRFRVLNGNVGVVDSDYYDRQKYSESFKQIFDEMRQLGLFEKTIPQIENSDLFKFSPFKALNQDQAGTVADIMDGLFADIEQRSGRTIVVQGDPGTGKTILAIYLMKLLVDIQSSRLDDDVDGDSLFADYFLEGYRELLQGFRIGLVVPQQSLRSSIKKVFKKTPSLAVEMVISPFDLEKTDGIFDLLIVDEGHRLTQRANQPSGFQNKKYREINEKLFGSDDLSFTQLDWIRAKSKYQILLVDAEQSVRPADLPQELLATLIEDSRLEGRYYRLYSQMRVKGGSDYIDYIRRVLSSAPPESTQFSEYDFKLYDDLGKMHQAVREREAESKLARLVAGYAWKWKSRSDPTAFDIVIDGCQLRWNKTDKDWINSSTAVDEVGSIHTVQGYDLNYAGVIIGPDLRYDPEDRRLFFDRSSYQDTKGKEDNPKRGIKYTDDDLLRYVRNVYAVLMTRGVRGTYVYVCDKPLREYLRGYIPRGTDAV